MIILAEGPNCSGKTLYLDFMQDQIESRGLEVVRVHFGAIEVDPFRCYLECLNEAHMQWFVNGKMTLIDRLHYGEPVYGEILRGKVQITEEQMDELDSIINSVGGLFAMFLPTVEMLEFNYEQRREQPPPWFVRETMEFGRVVHSRNDKRDVTMWLAEEPWTYDFLRSESINWLNWRLQK